MMSKIIETGINLPDAQVGNSSGAVVVDTGTFDNSERQFTQLFGRVVRKKAGNIATYYVILEDKGEEGGHPGWCGTPH